MSISNDFLENLDRKNCRRKNLNVPLESREQGLSVDGKEIEFPTKFARFVHRRKKMCKIIFYQKIRKI